MLTRGRYTKVCPMDRAAGPPRALESPRLSNVDAEYPRTHCPASLAARPTGVAVGFAKLAFEMTFLRMSLRNN